MILRFLGHTLVCSFFITLVFGIFGAGIALSPLPNALLLAGPIIALIAGPFLAAKFIDVSDRHRRRELGISVVLIGLALSAQGHIASIERILQKRPLDEALVELLGYVLLGPVLLFLPIWLGLRLGQNFWKKPRSKN